MLVHTFVHIPGVGYHTEEALWRLGARTWYDLLAGAYREVPCAHVLPFVAESVERLAEGDAPYFDCRLPSRERWRLLPDFLDRACFLDIETTGLSPGYDPITVVGLYDGREYRAFVRGFNLHLLPEALARYRLVVTYNGLRFDARFIEAHFGPVLRHMAHLDVMYPLRRLGIRGGLKAIEQRLGLARDDDLQGLSGYDAVLLWREYERGRTSALETLVRYNAEDVVALPALAVLAYNLLAAAVPVAPPRLPPLPRPHLDLPYDRALVARLRARHLE